MKKPHIKKKAFTLTELLVVVIVIGVLSAVVLPKFSKVLETRKTTEAEGLMSAVRTEQEKRCALDKNYLASLSEVKDILPASNTKNFSYSLTSTGMDAASTGKYGYKLRMPSYQDGRICCENEAECAKLNKDYPLCSTLMAQADYQSGVECAGAPPVIECSGSVSTSCGCLGKGTQTRTCDTSTGSWSGWNACSISDACSCEGESTRACGCNNDGTQTRACDTSTGSWSGWSSCSVGACECSAGQRETGSACGNCGNQKRVCGSDGSWGAWSCSGEGVCSPGKKKHCNVCGTSTCTSSCSWGACKGNGTYSAGFDNYCLSNGDCTQCPSGVAEWDLGGNDCIKGGQTYRWPCNPNEFPSEWPLL